MIKKLFTGSTALVALTLSLPLLLLVSMVGQNSWVSAAPGSPGNSEDPVIIYTENFENNQAAGPVPLLSYTGQAAMTYTANTAWRNNCNGEILFFNMLDNQFANTNCDGGDGTNTTTAYDAVRRLAHALGTVQGAATPATNRALTAYTDNGASYVDPGANLVQFETVGRVSLSSGTRRFIISNVDVAAINCSTNGTVQGKLRFYLLDGSSSRQVNQSAINICTNSAATSVTPPPLQSNGAIAPNNGVIRAGRVITDRALLSNTNSVGIRMINEEGGGQGNDNAIDNIQMADASPKLDKAFFPESVMVNEVSTMTFTVTNTSDLLAKEGWSFKDNLPENLKIANEPNADFTCPSGTVTAEPGATSVLYSGNISQGMTSCTLTIDVTSSEAGTYTNGPDNLEDTVGLHLPADAVVTFAPLAPDTGDKTNNSIAWYGMLITGVTCKSVLLKRKFAKK